MARILFLSLMLALTLAPSVVTAQQNLTGKWMIRQYLFDGRNMEEYARQESSPQPHSAEQQAREQAEVERLRQELHSSYLVFKADGSFASNFQGQATAGTWVFNPENNTVTVTEDRAIEFRVIYTPEGNLELSGTIDMDGRQMPIQLLLERAQ